MRYREGWGDWELGRANASKTWSNLTSTTIVCYCLSQWNTKVTASRTGEQSSHFTLHSCACAPMPACMPACMRACVRAHVHAYMHSCVRACACPCAYVSAHSHTCTHEFLQESLLIIGVIINSRVSVVFETEKAGTFCLLSCSLTSQSTSTPACVLLHSMCICEPDVDCWMRLKNAFGLITIDFARVKDALRLRMMVEHWCGALKIRIKVRLSVWGLTEGKREQSQSMWPWNTTKLIASWSRLKHWFIAATKK